MRTPEFHIDPNTLIASGSGGALLGSALFSVPGAVVGAFIGLGAGYMSEISQHRGRVRQARNAKKVEN